MFAEVIVGVDGRAGGLDAAHLAGLLADPVAGRTLVYVSATHPPSDQPALLPAELSDAAAFPSVFSRERDLCGGVTQIVRTVAPSAAAGLEETAQHRNADLIVVGRSRRHGLAHLVCGDDVRSLLHRTARAVAVAPAGFGQTPVSLTRIGVAYDGSPASRVAVAHAGTVAEQYDCELKLLRVLDPALEDPTRTVPGTASHARAAEPPARRRCEPVDGLEVEGVCGLVRSQLVAFSRGVDLLVCGSRRQGALRRLILGSVTDHLARHAQCALLIAPAPDTPRPQHNQARYRSVKS